jgi:hypothetical protein
MVHGMQWRFLRSHKGGGEKIFYIYSVSVTPHLLHRNGVTYILFVQLEERLTIKPDTYNLQTYPVYFFLLVDT